MLHPAAHPRHARRVVVCPDELFPVRWSHSPTFRHLFLSEAASRRAHVIGTTASRCTTPPVGERTVMAKRQIRECAR